MLTPIAQSTGRFFPRIQATLAGLSMSFLLAGCGGGDDANGGGAASLACDLSNFPGAPAGAVRTPTADELAGYFRSYTGTFDPVGNNVFLDATATLNSKGEVAVAWAGGSKTFTGKSFCYDTVIGAVDYGNTLYVNFAEGKVDLWKKNGLFAGFVKAPK